jgi:diamine N-acetyltransferase
VHAAPAGGSIRAMTPAAPLLLRPAVAGDAGVISALATQVFLDTYATEGVRPAVAREARASFDLPVIEALLATPRRQLLLAEACGHLRGFVQLMPGPLPQGARADGAAASVACEVERLYVQPRWQGRGVGRALMQQAGRQVLAAGRPWLWLTAWVGNTHALAWYARQGWQDVGATPYTFEGETFENRVLVKRLHPD